MSEELSAIMRTLYDVRKQKAALDKVEKSLLVHLKVVADPVLDRATEKADTPALVLDGLALTRIPSTSRSIKAELLLERGVSPEIVDYATRTTTYYQYRIKESVPDTPEGD